MSWRGATSIATALVLTLLSAGLVRAQGAAGSATVQDGSVVRIEYTLRNQASGEVIQTNRGGEALSYTQGRGQILPGLERQLAGMRVGEEKKVVVPPEDGYGPADASSRLEVPKAQIPSEAQRVGAHLMARSAEGQERPVVVTEVRETTVVLDLNHPLAGKTLLFDVRILGIDPPASTAPAPSSPPPSPPPPSPR